MIIDLFIGISPRAFLCTAVAAALGLVAVSSRTLFRVHAQSPSQAGTADSGTTVYVDVTPEHILNTIYPDTATGAWMDDLTKAQVDNLSKPETIQGIKNLGWGSITMRNNSELRLSAWHWNENGTWSDPATKSGYYVGTLKFSGTRWLNAGTDPNPVGLVKGPAGFGFASVGNC